jgi:hypothetical protein
MGIKGLAKLLSDEAPDVRVFVTLFILCFHDALLTIDASFLYYLV